MREELSKAEIAKDAVQHTVEAGAETVAAVSGIVSTAVRDVASAFGGFATELFEIRDAARRARLESVRSSESGHTATGPNSGQPGDEPGGLT